MGTEIPDQDSRAELEQDDRFPSGPWTGFFLQPIVPPGKHWMELTLTFRDGNVTGEGRDHVGEFLVRGRYTVSDGKCWFAKRYVGRHDVSYSGYNEGKGIWGIWDLLDPPWRGGFHIWPEGLGGPNGRASAAAAEVPDTIEVEAPAELVPAGAGV
jgi:hypothetical protein